MLRLNVEIPKLMRVLEKDSRGYPIPYIVLRDKSGQPQFTINNHHKVERCVTLKLCSICGRRMMDGYWFVGGSRCFLHERGAFIDPPLHLDCATYALRVCPFLAAMNYSKTIGERKIKDENRPDRLTLVRAEYMLPALPERFGLGHTNSYRVLPSKPGEMLLRDGGWDYVEWWRGGEQIDAPETGESPP